jgi:hypothetical protein
MTTKPYLLGIFLLISVLLSQTANADNRNHRRGYDGYGYSSYRGRDYYPRRYNRSYNRSYNRRANSYHYGSAGRRGNSYVSFSYGNYYPSYRYRSRYRNRGFDAGDFLGGLVLGSIISAPRYPARPAERVIDSSAPVVRTVQSSPPIYSSGSAIERPAPVASGRRLLKDLEGNCFERIIDENGDEIRIQLNTHECNF